MKVTKADGTVEVVPADALTRSKRPAKPRRRPRRARPRPRDRQAEQARYREQDELVRAMMERFDDPRA